MESKFGQTVLHVQGSHSILDDGVFCFKARSNEHEAEDLCQQTSGHGNLICSLIFVGKGGSHSPSDFVLTKGCCGSIPQNDGDMYFDELPSFFIRFSLALK